MLSHKSEPLTSFTVFPKLPFELRCMIWKASCCSRTIELDYDDIDGFTPRAADPKALRVCRESRELIIPLYPLCFGTFFHPARTRFNFVNDTLFIGSDMEDTIPHLFGTFTHSEISGLRFLALESCYNEHIEDANGATLTFQLLNLVKQLPSLRELLIVHDIEEMIDRSLDCAEGHTMELHDSPPPAFNHPAVYVDPLPDEENSLLKRWPVAKCRPVYGWRRCPDTDVFSAWDIEDDMEDNMSDNDAYYSRMPAWNPYSELFDSEDYDHGYGFPDDEDDDEEDEDGEDHDEAEDGEGEHEDDGVDGIIIESVD
ncbi:hypothetical protein QTJ16_002860 [Diplocarpon rosae]|uniref:2EXR domain-containing protein n=1 Tax=Diplocarpon rosae TaxID=946125 RepID=A0AAD9T3R5_9HELO|nr:hypothetical protein QTJ16_002860 [Diplocarpon rosae]PBP25815.1 hypothetical protein BUE80_DR003314 [Diplocarpon rosae]